MDANEALNQYDWITENVYIAVQNMDERSLVEVRYAAAGVWGHFLVGGEWNESSELPSTAAFATVQRIYTLANDCLWLLDSQYAQPARYVV